MKKENKAFVGINHGKGKIDLTKHNSDGRFNNVTEMKPIEIHLKEDGSVKDEPSFAIVMKNVFGAVVYGQISLEMLNEGLADIGYKIIKK